MPEKKAFSWPRLLIGILLLTFVILNLVPSAYYLLEPGPPIKIADLIEVENSSREEDWGNFYLTSVSQKRASLWEVIQFFLIPFDSEKELSPVEEAIPPGISEEQYFELMGQLMQESQIEARAAALTRAGYEVVIESRGVEVVSVFDDSPTRENLKPGDIITRVDDREIEMPTEAVDVISEREIGEKVRLNILRNEELIEKEVETFEYQERPGQASLGIIITSAGLDYEMPPLNIEFEEKDIVGPSAGLMFALEIYNQITEYDLTGGRDIAGSGEIDHRGNISRVAGIDMKIISAERENIGYFVLPEDNRPDIDDGRELDLEIITSESLEKLIEKLDIVRSFRPLHSITGV
ncbi:PDZ domain-containing protein [Halarsenatibacter silvermanii]|uniref:PDZ domain-containing protein n=2 Tax=Halarsenatibacter silvermanii TaxID=321763 RepID=A0A1G9NSQ3_9FIRM|nr:PDZ domain-containing protein [Halarsenatibacter silvermanii]